jgi:hypothetical protein
LKEGEVRWKADGVRTLVYDAYYHLHSNFTPFSNIGKTLTLQYKLEVDNEITCSQNFLTVYSTYPNSNFLFGPNTCKGASRIDVKFSNNGVAYQITKIIDPAYILRTAVAYKLVVPPNGTYLVYINNTLVESGSLANDFANENGGLPTGPDLFQFSGVGAVGLDLWQAVAGSTFDDILLTTS